MDYAPDISKCPAYIDKNDYTQECWLVRLSDETLSDDEVSKVALKKLKKDYSFTANQAPHLYNDDGECIDDNIYFIDQSTATQYGEGKRISDEQLTQGQKLAKMWHLANALCCKVYLRPKGKHHAGEKTILKTMFRSFLKNERRNLYTALKGKTLYYMAIYGGQHIRSYMRYLKGKQNG